jgi:uncharacterized protein
MMWKFVPAAALALLAAPSLADVQAGVDAWSAGDYERAVAQWQGLASAGDPDALFNLAQAYRLGRGVVVDIAIARSLYEKAASIGHLKAADNYGLMLFQEGEQAKAMPLIRDAAERGDPRAQYVLGLAHFNADYAPRDWVRAYALMTLANSANLPQARDALAQMDGYLPKAQLAQASSLAHELKTAARSQRTAEIAAAQPELPRGPKAPTKAPTSAPAADTLPAPELSAQPARKQGSWRVQLGAFGTATNADRLWMQIGSHAALKGTSKQLLPTGTLTRLLATGFASEGEAAGACAALRSEGKACVVAGQG